MNGNLSELAHAQQLIAQIKESDVPMKPVFSQLARQTGVSRQTISRMWNNYDHGFAQPKKRKSKFDPYKEEIMVRLAQPVTMKEVFLSFQNEDEHMIFTSYDSFKSYVRIERQKESGTHLTF